MSTRRLSTIALLAALCIVSRMAFGAFPNIKPITAIFFVSLAYLSTVDALLVMGVTLLGSGLIFGFGIIVFWQIASFAFLMVIWRYICMPLFSKVSLVWQSLLAAILAFSYGFFISLPIAFQFSTNVLVYWINGLFFDVLHGISTGMFYPIIHSIFRRFFQNEKNHYQS